MLKLFAEKRINWDDFIWRLLLLVLGTADGANTGSENNDAWGIRDPNSNKEVVIVIVWSFRFRSHFYHVFMLTSKRLTNF